LIFGEENFSGKLPFSYIASYDQSPAYKGYMDPSLEAPYQEGIYVGYRYLDKNNIKPLFPFGHGLSYTSYSYSDMTVNKTGDYSYTVSLKVKNTGDRAGSEVVQLYIAPQEPAADRPVKELKAFTKVSLAPGEEKTVDFKLNKRSFSRYDPEIKDWVADPGKYTVLAGHSSAEMGMPGVEIQL
jgi:beta-glucosidase